MKFSATPVTAALAGVFSAATWPMLWPLFEDTSSTSSILLMLGTIAFIALPAHVFVVGLKRRQPPGAQTLDTALLKRIGVWLLAAAITAAVIALYRN
ncbi:MAG TPA: hypothetical protein VMV48_03335 [Gallionellaceae bacterium]|nr:hypothetical protein [Gallionellaceae bacterium]